MEPIINPMLFYWINVVNNIRTINLCLLASSLSAFVVSLCFYTYTISEDGFDNESDEKQIRKTVAILLILSIFFSIMYIFFPSKNSIIEITIAQNLTANNIESGVEAVKDVTDYIIEAIKGF